jgi:hypothetical protein
MASDEEPSEHFPRQQYFRMASDEQPSEHFLGRSITYRLNVNDQYVKAVWKEEQLKKSIYPSFETAFRALGYDNVDWWNLLGKIAFGGKIKVKGPIFPKIPSYTDETIVHFMGSECALAKTLLNRVFNVEDNLPYSREPTAIGVEGTLKICRADAALRRSVITFRALDHPGKAFYRVIIDAHQGSVTRLFHFQPSIHWVCSRFPENCS